MPVEKPVFPWPYGIEKHTAYGFQAMAGTIMDEAPDDQFDLFEHPLPKPSMAATDAPKTVPHTRQNPMR
jgi:hypothetical protein